jgi:hypothetical protein
MDERRLHENILRPNPKALTPETANPEPQRREGAKKGAQRKAKRKFRYLTMPGQIDAGDFGRGGQFFHRPFLVSPVSFAFPSRLCAFAVKGCFRLVK